MKNSTAPATKADLHEVMEALNGSINRLYDANEKWKDDILESMEQWKVEIVRHFDVVVEDIRHDLEGANRDEISLLKDGRHEHENRIARLEQHTGLIAA